MGCTLVDLIHGYRRLAAVSVLAIGAALSPASAQTPASGRPIVAVLPLETCPAMRRRISSRKG